MTTKPARASRSTHHVFLLKLVFAVLATIVVLVLLTFTYLLAAAGHDVEAGATGLGAAVVVRSFFTLLGKMGGEQ